MYLGTSVRREEVERYVGIACSGNGLQLLDHLFWVGWVVNHTEGVSGRDGSTGELVAGRF